MDNSQNLDESVGHGPSTSTPVTAPQNPRKRTASSAQNVDAMRLPRSCKISKLNSVDGTCFELDNNVQKNIAKAISDVLKHASVQIPSTRVNVEEEDFVNVIINDDTFVTFIPGPSTSSVIKKKMAKTCRRPKNQVKRQCDAIGAFLAPCQINECQTPQNICNGINDGPSTSTPQPNRDVNRMRIQVPANCNIYNLNNMKNLVLCFQLDNNMQQNISNAISDVLKNASVPIPNTEVNIGEDIVSVIINYNTLVAFTPGPSTSTVSKRIQSFSNETESPSRIDLRECPICLESLRNKQISCTTCGHIFCKACILRVLKSTKLCPVCRAPLTKSKIHPLFI